MLVTQPGHLRTPCWFDRRDSPPQLIERGAAIRAQMGRDRAAHRHHRGAVQGMRLVISLGHCAEPLQAFQNANADPSVRSPGAPWLSLVTIRQPWFQQSHGRNAMARLNCLSLTLLVPVAITRAV